MKKLILALALGMLIGSAATAIAATSETVQATFAKFVFKVNGQNKEVNTTPLVVDGTSYLPVRELAGLLGYDVIYDDVKRTIQLDLKINSNPSTNTSSKDKKVEWVALSDLKTYNISYSERDNAKVILSKDSIKLEFLFPTEKSGQIVVATAQGDLNVLFANGTMSFHISDLKKYKLIPE